jgi:hypothetical protein
MDEVIKKFDLDYGDIRARAKSRAISRLAEREHLRLEIQSRKLLECIHDAAFMLFVGYEESQEEPGLFMPLTRDRQNSLKAGAEIALKLLNKVMPDLKQIELDRQSKEEGEKLLQDIELANRLRIYTESKAKRGEVIQLHPKPDYDFLN